MNLAQEAFKELYPEKKTTKDIRLKYSAKFKSYNANVKYNQEYIEFSLSKQWKNISEEIQKGLIQHLFQKMYKTKGQTLELDLYEKFMENIPKYSGERTTDPDLKIAFDKLNKIYFFDYMETPNLVWGKESFTKLGTYEYTSDTITISSVLRDEDFLMEYVLYHEMLHKDLHYERKNGRNSYHTPEFRRREKLFYEPDVDKKLSSFLKRKRLKKAFRFF